ncbi:hypothetical protein PGT21_036356 [Puccinia graminis f. sp. tritici]|uniref:Uncharacterized protein n=1 Tax=Puccinia graminis f. sp. tritici TaxID=56615 RepID=A0A5B0PAC0_PUCGR|nr:hypothetical protein PGT21_036356 [Puccinia graminis f. sp. tritici]KAA1100385.1 hypothetical protein PGTUg99_024823 [Puccinia graminis f. sp. tritici]
MRGEDTISSETAGKCKPSSPNHRDMNKVTVVWFFIDLVEVICDAFDSLSDRCEMPLDSDDECDIRPCWGDTATSINPHQLNSPDLKSLLIQLETGILPLLRQQLDGMSASLDMADPDPSKYPRPNFREAMEITSQLGQMVEQIKSSYDNIALIAPEAPKDKDHHCGLLKGFRIDTLLNILRRFIGDDLRWVFDYFRYSISTWLTVEDYESNEFHHRKLIAKKTKCFKVLDFLAQWSKISDFGIAQNEWQLSVDRFDKYLEDLIVRVTPAILFEEETGDVDEARSHASSSSGSGDERAGDSLSSTSEGDTPETSADSSLAELEDSESEDDGHLPRRPSPVNSLRPDIFKLAQLAVPLLKLGRIFFYKLLPTPTTKPRFTTSTRLSSDEMSPLMREVVSVGRYLWQLGQELAGAYDGASLYHDSTQKYLDTVLYHFEFSVELLSLHVIPLPAQVGFTTSEDLFDDCFSLLISQFLLAAQKLRDGLDAFACIHLS